MTDAVWQALVLVLLVSVVVEAILMIAVMKQVGGLLLHLRPGRIGEVGGGPSLGLHVDLPDVAWDRPAVALFISPRCRMCGPIAEAVPTVRVHFPEVELIGVVVGGDDDEERAGYAERIGTWARSDLAHLGDRWEIPGTPFAVGIDAEGYVQRAGVVNSLDQLEDLAESLSVDRSLGSEGVRNESPGNQPTSVESLATGRRA